ncbi:MAG: hypothetical protein NXI15_05540 [Gammaproteobacteria bacterium]|nr:hypothetical protein [Gammaproteobacteria bacterium]
MPGLLQRSDSVCVELAAGLLCQYRDDPTGFPASKLTLLRGFFRDLGLTPDGRQRFGIAPESKHENEFDVF